MLAYKVYQPPASLVSAPLGTGSGYFAPGTLRLFIYKIQQNNIQFVINPQ